MKIGLITINRCEHRQLSKANKDVHEFFKIDTPEAASKVDVDTVMFGMSSIHMDALLLSRIVLSLNQKENEKGTESTEVIKKG